METAFIEVVSVPLFSSEYPTDQTSNYYYLEVRNQTSKEGNTGPFDVWLLLVIQVSG